MTVTCTVCTFENHPIMSACEMCQTPLETDDSISQVAIHFEDMSLLPETYVKCPHCGLAIEIVEVNCSIFMCGFTRNSPQLPQHDEAFAARAVASGMVFGGCGRQFQLVAGKAVACTGK